MRLDQDVHVLTCIDLDPVRITAASQNRYLCYSVEKVAGWSPMIWISYKDFIHITSQVVSVHPTHILQCAIEHDCTLRSVNEMLD